MLDKIMHIKSGDKEYPVTFTLNVMEAIQDKYGTFEKWFDKLSTDEPKVSDITWLIKEMMNEAIDIENEEREAKEPKLEHKQVGRILTKVGMTKAVEIIFELVAKSTPDGDDDPNLTANQ